ncbi:DUF4846 domain-containing protein [Niabella terrae]
MKIMLFPGYLSWLALGCGAGGSGSLPATQFVAAPGPAAMVKAVPLPPGFQYDACSEKSFGQYLSECRVKTDKTVYLYNGKPKANQDAQYAVLDIPIGKKDLQQCADAVMRLRAEYLYQIKNFKAISFTTVSGVVLNFEDWRRGRRYVLRGGQIHPVNVRPEAALRQSLDSYLEFVFSYCGTASLPASMKKKPLKYISAGDVLLQPGSPGHAVIVMATASNLKGQKIYMLAQSYMPAQSIHLLNNPGLAASSPWYSLNDADQITTPEWVFDRNALFEWR